MVLYRKYRPQTLDELVGQTIVKQALQSALSSDKLSHAYLFCGPRGTGKTSTARILAKIVNCEAAYGIQQTADSPLRPRSEASSKQLAASCSLPCNSCPTCLSITDGSNLDVVEMDAASNRGIDDIRSLRENIKLSPTSAKKKVYIIDEVHMLSGEAFNALLKTLEEPPSHVLFILATTEAQKIPQTILSRVSRLDFKPAVVEELVEAIKKVAEKEKIKVEDNALLLLAKSAQGSFRDGVKLLDLLSGYQTINEGVVIEVLKTGVLENTCILLTNIAERETKEALNNLTQELQSGTNIKEFSLAILDTLRQLLLIKHGLGEQVKPEVGEKYSLLEDLGAKFDLDQLIKTINCFQNSLEQNRYVSISALPLELAVVESCGNIEFEKKLDVRNEKIEKEVGSLKLEEDQASNFQHHSPTSSIQHLTSSDDLSKIAEKWPYVLETVRSFNFSLEALLRSAKISHCDELNIVVEVPYSFHQRILEAPKSKDLLESIFADILGRSIRIGTALGQRAIRKEEIANIEVAADDEIIRAAAEIFNSEPN